jgi:hypothetical protein
MKMKMASASITRITPTPSPHICLHPKDATPQFPPTTKLLYNDWESGIFYHYDYQ